MLLFPGHALEVPEDGNLVASLFQALDRPRDRRVERIRPTKRPIRMDPRLELIQSRPGRAVAARPAPTLIRPRPQTRRRGALDRGLVVGELLGGGGRSLADPALAVLLDKIGAADAERGGIGDTLGGDPTDEGELYDAEDADSEEEEEDASGEAVTDGADDPLDTAEVACEPLEFQYRTVRFQVDSCWYSAYMDDWERLYRGSATALHRDRRLGKVSSMNTFLDFAWREFRGATVGDVDTLDSLLLCWNLPSASEGTESFWMTDKGPAREAYRTVLQLILTYADLIQPEVSPCDGYAAFVRSVLQGKTTANNKGLKCQIRFRLGNVDTRFEAGDGVTHCGLSHDCTSGYQDQKNYDGKCPGYPWDVYKDIYAWVSDEHCLSGRGPQDGACVGPLDGCGGNASADSDHFVVNYPPASMAWDGFVCDRILFIARMAFDYALDHLDEGWDIILERLAGVRELAGYALRVLVQTGYLWVHELGHNLNGVGGHCPLNCCMDAGGYGWECAVSARLGLPMNSTWPASDGDYPGSAVLGSRLHEGCSNGNGPVNYKDRYCYFNSAGVPHGWMAFSHTNCYADGGHPTEYYTFNTIRDH